MAKNVSPQDVELRDDAWEHFERAVDAVSKSGPQHRPAKSSPEKVQKSDDANDKRDRRNRGGGNRGD